jgi:hypothetical protein
VAKDDGEPNPNKDSLQGRIAAARRREQLLGEIRLLLLAKDDRTAQRVERELQGIRLTYRHLLAGRGPTRRTR